MSTLVSVIIGLSIIGEVMLTLYFAIISEDDAFWPIRRVWRATKRELNLFGRIICAGIIAILDIPCLIIYGMTYTILAIGIGIWEAFKFVFKKR